MLNLIVMSNFSIFELKKIFKKIFFQNQNCFLNMKLGTNINSNVLNLIISFIYLFIYFQKNNIEK